MIRIHHLETDVTQACQLSCVACNHHVPLYRAAGPKATTREQVAKDLNALAKILHADRWGALGGEPLLHHDLVGILHAARASGIADKIEVWTNGLLLPRQSDAFWGSFDCLVLSIYDGKHNDESLRWIRDRCDQARVELILKDEVHNPNFKTLFEPTPTDDATTRAKFASCFFRSYSRVANNGFFFTCCCAPHMPVLVLNKPFGTDGIAIEGLTEQALDAYLTRSEPLSSCSTCAGRDTAKSIRWSEEKNPEAWMLRSAGL